MRILLTNHGLVDRAGSELYIRDVAIALMRRGHHPVAYSTNLGRVADELRAAGVPVIRTLDSLGEAPDIIHGHHHFEALTAMLAFPQTPAIYYCHGWLPWEEAPLRFPSILRYVAVDELCRERLITEGGIAPERIEVIMNFFDHERFPPRSPLPPSPRLALAFSNEFSERNDIPVLREACAQCGIELHATGREIGTPEADPGRRLGRYDVVFAKARCAIEAMAVGSAVVLCCPGRLGPMVTAENFASLRRLNFGIRTLSRPLEVDLLIRELRSYDSADAEAVSRLTREQCRLDQAVDHLVSLYDRVIAEAPSRLPAASGNSERAAARYLEESAPQYKTISAERQKWIQRCLEAESTLNVVKAEHMSHSEDARKRLLEAERAIQELETKRTMQLAEASRALEDKDSSLRELEQSRQHWIERCHSAEHALAEREDKRVLQAAEASRALYEKDARVRELEESQAQWMEQYLVVERSLAEREEKLAVLENEISAIHSSATWRWTQSVLRSWPAQRLLGPFIRAVAERAQRNEASSL